MVVDWSAICLIDDLLNLDSILNRANWLQCVTAYESHNDVRVIIIIIIIGLESVSASEDVIGDL